MLTAPLWLDCHVDCPYRDSRNGLYIIGTPSLAAGPLPVATAPAACARARFFEVPPTAAPPPRNKPRDFL